MSHPAHRIISLSPDLTELVFALGAGKALVGVIAGSDYPAAAKRVRQVGDYRALDLESIVALKPDLILAWGESHAQAIAILKQLAIPVFVSHTHHLLDIPLTMRRLGCLTSKEQAASQLAEHFLHQYTQLQQKYRSATPVRVFYQLALHPWMTINRTSWIDDAITLCGGTNIFADTGFAAPFQQTAFAVSTEAVLKADPQLVIADLSPGWQQTWQRWPSVAAVKNHHLVSVDPDLIERAGPRILTGVAELCQRVASVRPIYS